MSADAETDPRGLSAIVDGDGAGRVSVPAGGIGSAVLRPRVVSTDVSGSPPWIRMSRSSCPATTSRSMLWDRYLVLHRSDARQAAR